MAWSLPWTRKASVLARPPGATDPDADDAWSQHVTTLAAHGIPEPGAATQDRQRRPATVPPVRGPEILRTFGVTQGVCH